MRGKALRSYLRLELADALRTKWVALTLLVYLTLMGAFVWLGLRESSVLGFTGLSRVLLNIANAIILIFPLVVLIGTHSAIVRGRTSGFCELMLVHPIKRSTWFNAVLLSRLILLVGPLLLLMLGCIAGGLAFTDEPEIIGVAIRSMAISAALVFAFVGIGLFISVWAKSAERAIVWALLAFVVTAALHDVLLISALLRTPIPPEVVFFLAALNPSEAARVGVLSSVDPELAVLGPVGFWLANTLGSQLTLLIAIGWPLTLGGLTIWGSRRKLRSADLVA